MSRKAMTFTVTIPLPAVMDPLTGMRRAVVTLWATLLVWQRRAEERQQLRNMPEHMRRDIGLTAEQCRDEAGKPFWMV
jgi:uncharacterized protein YjiS (DUF1127 family)